MTRWFDSTRYQLRGSRPSTPSTSSRSAPIRPRIAPLQLIHAWAIQIMRALVHRRHAAMGMSSFASATTSRIGTQNTTFSTISEMVMTPFSVEPRDVCTSCRSCTRGVRLCPGQRPWSMPCCQLSAPTRVVGCLLEKQIATPDQYPLSLNALVNACNQKSNRDPVMNLQERAVQPVVDALIRKQIVQKSGSAAACRSITSCSATPSSAA